MMEVRVLREHGEMISVWMNETETVYDLRQKLWLDHRIPVHYQYIKLGDSLVDDNYTIRSLGYDNSNIITLQLELHYVLNIRTYNGYIFELEVSSHELVDNLVSTISRYMDVPVCHLGEIRHDNGVLEAGHRVSEYDISDGATLIVAHGNYKTIYLRTLTGGVITIDVHTTVTVDQVKKVIEEQEGIPIRKQRLFFCGRYLRGDKNFFDYHTERENTVHLIVREGKGFEVYMDVPGGENYVLEVNPDDSLEQLKETLHDKLEIPKDMQRVYLGDRLLSDSCSLSENSVDYHCTLRLALAPDCVQVTMVVSQGITFPFWVRLDETVQHLKEVVAEHEQTDIRFVQLRCFQSIMEANHTLRHYRIGANQTIYVSITRPVLISLRVTVRGTQPSTVLDLLEPITSTVLNIKETLAQKLHTKVQDMQLFLDGNELEDTKSLFHSGVLNFSNLDLILQPLGRSGTATALGNAKSMQLFVKTLTGKTMMVDVKSTDTILAIKEQIRDIEGVPISDQCLVVGGRVLDNSVNLTSYSIQNLSIIHLVVRVPSQAPVNVTVEHAGQTFQLSLVLDHTIGYLKEQVELCTGISRHNLILLMEDLALEENHQTLAEYNIDEGAVVRAESLH